MTTDYQEINGLGRTRPPLSRSKQLLRTIIHLLSYHFILKQRRTTVTHAAGFRLALRPTVFHPRYFLTSEFFATFIGSIDLTGKRVADVGTGSGILALAAARAGAASVVAIDINPNAAGAAAENAHANGFSKRVTAVAVVLLEVVPPSVPVPIANPRQLTDDGESVDSSLDERSLQFALVHLDWAVPIAGRVGSRNPRASASAQRSTPQLPEAGDS